MFIGSETGMYIYDVKRPDFPQFLSSVSHVRSCDPVVSAGKYAYVTLNSASIRCGRGTNVLMIYNVSNPLYPILEKEIPMNAPKGLGIDGNKLFNTDEFNAVCDYYYDLRYRGFHHAFGFSVGYAW